MRKLSERTAHEGKMATIKVGRFAHADGEEVEREWAEKDGAVAVVAHDGERVWLVRQPREATGVEDLLELPAGKLDVEGEAPLDCAKRELAEEIGKAAATWEPLTSFFTSPGFTDEECHVFLATDLSDDPGKAIEGERITVEARPLGELDALIDECRDSKTLIGLLLLRRRLG